MDNISCQEINCTIFSCKEIIDHITTFKKENRNWKQEKPKWIVNLESDIERLRTEIAHVQVIITFENKGKFAKHQNTILHQLRKKSGNTKMRTLETKSALLEQDLKRKSEKFKFRNRLSQRKQVNDQFFKGQNEPSETHMKNRFVSWKSYVPFLRYWSFCILTIPFFTKFVTP